MATDSAIRTIVQLNVDYPGRDTTETPLQVELRGSELRITEVGVDPDEDFDGMFAVVPVGAMIQAIHRLAPYEFERVYRELGGFAGYEYVGPE